MISEEDWDKLEALLIASAITMTASIIFGIVLYILLQD